MLSKSVVCCVEAGEEYLQSPPATVDATSLIYGTVADATAKLAHGPEVISRGVEFSFLHPFVQVARVSSGLNLMQIQMRSTLSSVEVWEEGAARRHWKCTH
jgi:hypothetical protein